MEKRNALSLLDIATCIQALRSSGGFVEILSRQDFPKVYALNGAVYVAGRDWLFRERNFLTDQTIGYERPKEHSLDIDKEQDVHLFEFMLSSSLG